MAVDVTVTDAAPEATAAQVETPTTAAPTAEPQAETSPGNPTGDPSSPAEEPAEATSPEEQKSRSERRAEARRQAAEAQADTARRAADEAAFQRRLDDALAERDRLKADAAAREAAAAADEQFVREHVGTEEQYQAARRKALEPVPDYSDLDYDRKYAEIEAAKAEVRRLETGRDLAGKIATKAQQAADARAWGVIADQYETGALLPDVDAAAYRAAPDVPAALKVIRDSVAANVEARLQAVIDDLKADLEIERSERSAAQAAAGGRSASPMAGGTGSSNRGVYTRAQLRDMMATPSGLAEYRANRAEIERQEAAGLIR